MLVETQSTSGSIPQDITLCPVECSIAEHITPPGRIFGGHEIESVGKCETDGILSTKTTSSQKGDLVAGLSFCEEVRRRVNNMQLELQAREHTIASLNVQLKSLQSSHRHASMSTPLLDHDKVEPLSMKMISRCSEELTTLHQSHETALSGQQADSEAALKRHLDLIDRLLADKDALSKQVDHTNKQLAVLEGKHADTIAAMKSGWAQELKRQKDGWAASEKVTTMIGLTPPLHYCLSKD